MNIIEKHHSLAARTVFPFFNSYLCSGSTSTSSWLRMLSTMTPGVYFPYTLTQRHIQVPHRGANWHWEMSFYSVNGNWRVWQLGQCYRGVLHCWFLLLSNTAHGQKDLKFLTQKCPIPQSLYYTMLTPFCRKHLWIGLPEGVAMCKITFRCQSGSCEKLIDGKCHRTNISSDYYSKIKVLVMNKHSNSPVRAAPCLCWQ